MKPTRELLTKQLPDEVTGDSETFTGFMRKLMQVPRAEVKVLLDADKARKAKRRAVRASVLASKAR